MIYTLPKKVIDDGIAYHNEVIKNLPDTPNYTGLEAPYRFATGWYGEWGFEQFLDGHGVKYIHHPKDPRHIDKGDFIINGEIYNMKAANGLYPDGLVSVDCYKKHPEDNYYVFSNIIRGQVKIALGMISRERTGQIKPQRKPRHIWNHVVPYTMLSPFIFLPQQMTFGGTFGEDHVFSA